MTRSVTRQISLAATQERVFELLVKPADIRQWWHATTVIVISMQGGLWAATWGADEDTPDYIVAASIREYEPPRRLVLAYDQYYAKSGPLPFEADFTAEFRIENEGPETTLVVTQDGFPTDEIADEYYHGCEQGWEQTLADIAAYVRQHG